MTPSIRDGDVRANLDTDIVLRWNAYASTEARILTSRRLAEKTVDRLVRRGAALAREKRELLRDSIQRRITVMPDERARVMTVTAVGSTAEDAADVANAACDAYVEDQVERRHEVVAKAVDSLRARAGEIRGEASRTEASVEAFRAKKTRYALPFEEELRQRQAELARVHEALTEAHIERIELEAENEDPAAMKRAERVEKALRKELEIHTHGLDALLSNQPEWRRLNRERDDARERLDRLIRQLAELDVERQPVLNPVRVLDRAVP